MVLGWASSPVCRALAYQAQIPRFNSRHHHNKVWCSIPAVLALQRQRLEDCKFKVTFKLETIKGYMRWYRNKVTTTATSPNPK